MGVTHVTTRISNLAQDAEPWEAEFLVDTGAIDCLAPRERLIAAGIRPEGKRVDELANGQASCDTLRRVCWTIVASGGHLHIEDTRPSARP